MCCGRGAVRRRIISRTTTDDCADPRCRELNSVDTGKNPSAQRRRGILAGVSSNVLVLGVVSLLMDMSSEMIYPILPLFLVSIGATGLFIGLIEGAAETTASLLKVVAGWYSDRYQRRKPFVLGGYGASSLIKPVLIFATSPWHVLGVRLAERVGKGVRSAPRDALIADSTPVGSRGKAFGFHKAMDSTGAVAGPLVALAILALAVGMEDREAYRTVFIFATIPAFLAVAVIVAFVREKEVSVKGATGTFAHEVGTLGRPFWLLLAVMVTFYIGEISYVFFVLQAQANDLSDTAIIVLYIFFNVVFVFVALLSGGLSDRFGRKPIIVVSFTVFALTCATMAAAGSVWVLALGFTLFGFYKGSSEGVLKAYVVDLIPSNLRGTALGAFHTAVGMVMLPGGIIAGLLWDSYGPWATFSFGGVMAATATVMLVVFVRRTGAT